MSRRLFSMLTFIGAGLFFTGVALGAAPRPNLLLITVDDMNADSVGIFGSSVPNITPNIDQLAAEGLRFERAHVQVANCMPSRNVMWSGRYPQTNKIGGFYQVEDPGYLTLADLAKNAGYFTGIRHKVHDSTPHTPYEWDAILDVLPEKGKLHRKDPKSYGLATAEGIRLAKSEDKPFCLLINIADPHLPFYGLDRQGRAMNDPFVPSRVYGADEVTVPGFLPDDPVVREELAHYFSSVRRADDAVEQVLLALQESGQADNTLVMLLSDHGMPFPFAKTQLYHHSTRTPLVFRWPKTIEANSVDSEHMVSAVDILPTLLNVIDADIPLGIEGRSFKPLLLGQSQGGREAVFKSYNENASGAREPMRAVESSKYLYIFNPWSNGKRSLFSATNDTETHQRMEQIAQGDEQMSARMTLLKHRVLEEFYDVENDPDCLVNLIDSPALQNEIAAYRDLLENWLRKTQDPTLTAFLGRKDPKVLSRYMREQRTEARMRKQAQSGSL